MTVLGALHVGGAFLALGAGLAVWLTRKGTRRHRRLGQVYGVTMLLLNAAALLLYQETGQWGAFHWLALISLATLAAGLLPLLLGQRGAAVVGRHAYFMGWSYVGLVAAGVAQLAADRLPLPAWLAVSLASGLVIAVGAWLVHGLTPRTLRVLFVR